MIKRNSKLHPKKEIAGKTLRLSFHMETEFSPELELSVRQGIMRAFRDYWFEKIDIEILNDRLIELGIDKGIEANDLHSFLKANDVQ